MHKVDPKQNTDKEQRKTTEEFGPERWLSQSRKFLPSLKS